MTNNEDFKFNSNHPWCLHSNFGDPIVAYKRHRRNVYAVSADCRHALDVILDERLPRAGGKRAPMTLDNARKTWWMSESQFQQMLTRLGLPF